MEITQAALKERFYYEDGHLHYRKTLRYNARKGDRAGHLHSTGYVHIAIAGKRCYEHLLIFLFHYGYLPKYADHINRIKDDNRVENLREATKSQDNANKNPRKDGTSKFKGVSLNKDPYRNSWRAQIHINGWTKYIGIFNTEVEAAAAYDSAAIGAFGEFAHTNKQAGLL